MERVLCPVICVATRSGTPRAPGCGPQSGRNRQGSGQEFPPLRAAFQFRLKFPYPAPLVRPLLLDEEDPRADDALPLELLGRGSLPLEKLPGSSVKRKTAPFRFFVAPAL